MRRLIIAEKPMLADDIAKALIPNTNKAGGYYISDDYVIIPAFGHLMRLKDAHEYDEKYAKWNLADLPIYFEKWEAVSSDEDSKKARLNLIGKYLKEVDEVIHAGDPDDEGQLLIDEILEYFNYQGSVKRVLINDSLTANILKAFDNLEDNSVYYPLGRSAFARQMADKSFGINESRLASLKLNRKGLSIGRVQTPTLALVVNRDKEIETHKERYYYDLSFLLNLENEHQNYMKVPFTFKWNTSEEDKKIYDENVAETLSKEIANASGSVDTVVKNKTTAPPLPFNFSILASDMNKKYGYSIKETLAITQSLRDNHKAITYNRSDSQYLKEEHYQEAETVIGFVFGNIKTEYPVDYTIRSKCFNDSKTSAHHGIIPQAINVDLGRLTDKEKNVYVAVCERYIMQFLPPMEQEVSETIINIDEGVLSCKQSKTIDLGWTEHFKTDTEKEETVPFIASGSYQYQVDSSAVSKKKTSPRKRYTPATLNADMSSIAKYVTEEEMKNILKEKDKDLAGEHGGIGTSATRGDIIENLINKGFLTMEKKNIVSTPLGREFCDLLPPSLKSADTTAKWWLIQQQIKEGNKNPYDLLHSVVDEFNAHKDTSYQNAKLSVNTTEKEVIGKCFFCGADVYESHGSGAKTYYCSKYKDGCKFKLYEKTKRFNDELKITKQKASSLLQGKAVSFKLTSKAGDKYDMKLKLARNGD